VPGTCVIGLQWGDEAKGKLVDILTEAHDVVVRYAGGANAGHTVVFGGQTWKLSIIPSGILRGGVACVITGGVVLARDPELGLNSGIYRFIVKEKNLTGIDIVTPNNMRLFAQRALERNEPLPISISLQEPWPTACASPPASDAMPPPASSFNARWRMPFWSASRLRSPATNRAIP
jgi:hypothetical protein